MQPNYVTSSGKEELLHCKHY